MSHIAIAAYKKTAQAPPALALSIDGEIYDLEAARKAGVKLGEVNSDDGLPALLAQWRDNATLTRACEEIAQLARTGKLQAVPGGAGALTAPFRPDRIFCAASNYVEHANEMGTVLAAKSESKPYMFLKLRNTVIGPGEAIRMPPETSQLDWEIELAAVIGKRCRRIPVDAGARRRRRLHNRQRHLRARPQRARGLPVQVRLVPGQVPRHLRPVRAMDRAGLADPRSAGVATGARGQRQVMQKDTTANMIWTVREQIAYLSTIVTLEPGDVIATGTPTGVGMGRGIFLKAGDVVSASIDGIGTLTNPVRAETLG